MHNVLIQNTAKELTKFHELCSAYGLAQDNFEAYRIDCHLLAVEIVKE